MHTLQIDLRKLMDEAGLSIAEVARRGDIDLFQLSWFLRTDKPHRQQERQMQTIGTILAVVKAARPDLVQDNETFRLVEVQAPGQEVQNDANVRAES